MVSLKQRYAFEILIPISTRGNKDIQRPTGLRVMHSSSHLTVRSTDVLFLFAETHAGTSSAREAHKFGFMEEIMSMYSTGFICKIHRFKEK